MAPRAIESKEQVVARLRGVAGRAGEVMRFGGHHFTHAIVVRDGAWQVRRLVLSAGAGFLVPLLGDIIRMPGLPATPQADKIDLVDGEIVGILG